MSRGKHLSLEEARIMVMGWMALSYGEVTVRKLP